MAKKESENILDDIHKLEKDIHFYKTELLSTRPTKYVSAVHKLLSEVEEERRHLMFKQKEAERREDLAEKNKK